MVEREILLLVDTGGGIRWEKAVPNAEEEFLTAKINVKKKGNYAVLSIVVCSSDRGID